MHKNRRNAQIGLLAAALLLVGCLSVLFATDRAAAENAQSQTGPATEVRTEAAARPDAGL